MTSGEWVIAFATFAGPIFAVQAQKSIERRRDISDRKQRLLQTLMATRGARLSHEHVGALNMIDLTFYSRVLIGHSMRTKKEQDVLDAWKEYLDHLSTPEPNEEAAKAAFYGSREELFINLLADLAKERRFTFDRVHLKKGAYAPMAHGMIEEKQLAMLDGAAEVFGGRRPIRIAPEAVAAPDTGVRRQTV
ncbi:DUF6680 family protein [Pararobbsia alpina]|uniref:DUF6680 domain-containing protein n=1 Tax=Pararobbsia alpina TaxID=621374 RepID=A0A6S7D3T1_9BURK|nr:DUF6680 family protein [Pararobbsia alpina]CAB3805639.1 hypothetical protein LMG28138_05701 [Pararobbsia alpina]